MTWSHPALPGEDAQISDDQAYSGTNSLVILSNNDVLLYTNLNSGHYLVEFWMYILDGKLGYYNFQQVYTGDTTGVWAFSAYFYSGGVGNLVIAAQQFPFEWTEGEWFTCSHEIDIDSDTASIFIGGTEIYSWPWSTAQGVPPANLDGIDFYGLPDPPGSQYYLDDVSIVAL
jgi:hypothetical protein